MPRFFFHMDDGHTSLDADGVELAGPDEAREAAVVAAGEALRDLGKRFWTSPEWRMWVMDESGAPVCAVRFSGDATLGASRKTDA